MSTNARTLSPRGTPFQVPRPRQAFSTQAALGRVGWTPPRPNPTTDIPGLANLPVLDGAASVAASRPARAVAQLPLPPPPTIPAPIRMTRLVRRRGANHNLRGAMATNPPQTPPPIPPLHPDRLAARFGHINLRTPATPARHAPPTVATPTAPRRLAPAPAPATPPPAARRVQWPVRGTRTAGDIQRAAAARRLVRTKQMATDRFNHFHASLDHWNAWDRDARGPYWSRLPIPPRRGGWPGHKPLARGEALSKLWEYDENLRRRQREVTAAVRQGAVRRVLERVRRRVFRRRGGLGEEEEEEEVVVVVGGVDEDGEKRRRVDRLNARLEEDFVPAGIRFKRRLGQGGFGAVFLFEMVAEKGVGYPIVVKASTQELRAVGNTFDEEIDHLNLMNGARHFVQRFFLQDLPLPAPKRRRKLRLAARNGLSGNIREAVKNARNPDQVPGYTAEELQQLRMARRSLDSARNIIVLENMPRGDIVDLIIKLVAKKQRLSSRALWAIFECLFKGCVGMATPGRFHEAGHDPQAHAMTEQEETVPDWLHDGTQRPTRPMVHFDLDPQNGKFPSLDWSMNMGWLINKASALVGNFGEEGGPHENIPIVKIADPGLAVIVDDGVRKDESKLWTLRARGKPDYLHPEQFTREWEYRAAIDLFNLAREPTAGNYNWWSNLYQVGWIMWSLVTQCFPPAPPRAWPYTYESEEAGVMQDSDGFTYGIHVMATEYNYCDLELRRQILRCLDHDATQRPKMGWMESVFLFNVGRPDLVQAESDEQLRAHINEVYGDPGV